jgi:hypothetical protein
MNTVAEILKPGQVWEVNSVPGIIRIFKFIDKTHKGKSYVEHVLKEQDRFLIVSVDVNPYMTYSRNNEEVLAVIEKTYCYVKILIDQQNWIVDHYFIRPNDVYDRFTLLGDV